MDALGFININSLRLSPLTLPIFQVQMLIVMIICFEFFSKCRVGSIVGVPGPNFLPWNPVLVAYKSDP